MTILELAAKLEQILVTQNARIYKYLQPGLTRVEIEHIFDSYGIRNRRIVELFEWKNGTNFSEQLAYEHYFLFSCYCMYSIQDLINTYKSNRESILGKGKKYITVFDFGGVTLLVKNNSDDIFVYEYNAYLSSSPYKKYESIETMLLTIIACFNEGAYVINENGMVETDFDLEWTISKKMNPNCKIWTNEIG